MQTRISCLQVFTVVYPSMVNNSETLKNLNGIEPDFFFTISGSSTRPFMNFYIQKMDRLPTLYTKQAIKNMKISLMEYQHH